VLCREAEGRVSEFAEQEVRRHEQLATDEPTIDHQHRLADAYIELGMLYIITDRFAEAAVPNREAIRLRPTDYQPWNNLGYSLEKLGMLSDAAAAYREAVRCEPDVPTPRNNLARVLSARADELGHAGRWEEAAATLEESIEAKGNSAQAQEPLQWYRAASAWALAGDRDAYEEHCRRMLDRYSGLLDMQSAQLVARGSLLLPETQHQQEAIQLAERAIDAVKADALPVYNLLTRSLAEYRAGRYEQAVQWNETALARKDMPPSRRTAHQFVQAMAVSRLGRHDDARAMLTEALKTGSPPTLSLSGDLVEELLRREAIALLPVEAQRPRTR
jgi:tetratricopeptide (TPR) repeat protein